jgi:hypothetical protein
MAASSKFPFRQGLADHHHSLRTLRVAILNPSACARRYADHGKESSAHSCSVEPFRLGSPRKVGSHHLVDAEFLKGAGHVLEIRQLWGRKLDP